MLYSVHAQAWNITTRYGKDTFSAQQNFSTSLNWLVFERQSQAKPAWNFGAEQLSGRASDPNYVLNRLAAAVAYSNLLLTGLDTIEQQYGDNYFVNSPSLNATVEEVTNLILRANCILGSCLWPSFGSFLSNVCSTSLPVNRCKGLVGVNTSAVHGVTFAVHNLGRVASSATNFSVWLPAGQTIVGLFSVNDSSPTNVQAVFVPVPVTGKRGAYAETSESTSRAACASTSSRCQAWSRSRSGSSSARSTAAWERRATCCSR